MNNGKTCKCEVNFFSCHGRSRNFHIREKKKKEIAIFKSSQKVQDCYWSRLE